MNKMKQLIALAMITLFSIGAVIVNAQTKPGAKAAQQMYRAGMTLGPKEMKRFVMYNKTKPTPETNTANTVNGQDFKLGQKLDAGQAQMLNDAEKAFMDQNYKNDIENKAKIEANKEKGMQKPTAAKASKDMYRAGMTLGPKEMKRFVMYSRTKATPESNTINKVNGQEFKLGQKLDAGQAQMLNDAEKAFMDQNYKNDMANKAKVEAAKAKAGKK